MPAAVNALWRRRYDKAQYTSAEFARLARGCQVVLSHGRTGQCWDKALGESFFSALKGELLDDHACPTRVTARNAITEYIAWYNGTRLHSALGYKLPAEYETTSRQETFRHVALANHQPCPSKQRGPGYGRRG